MFASEISFELIARRFVDAFNRRDVEGLAALADPEIELHPSTLVGHRRRYDGHEGLRRWIEELGRRGIEHQVRVRQVHPSRDGFIILSEVLLDGAVITPGAMIARLNERHEIAEARMFLTDAELLARVGVVPGNSVRPV